RGRGIRADRAARIARARARDPSRARAGDPADALRGRPYADADRRADRDLPDARFAPDTQVACQDAGPPDLSPAHPLQRRTASRAGVGSAPPFDVTSRGEVHMRLSRWVVVPLLALGAFVLVAF